MSEEITITDQANTNTMREARVLARHLKRDALKVGLGET